MTEEEAKKWLDNSRFARRPPEEFKECADAFWEGFFTGLSEYDDMIPFEEDIVIDWYNDQELEDLYWMGYERGHPESPFNKGE